jgi:kinesin family member 15
VRSLLNPQSFALNMREDLKRGVYVENLKEESIRSAEECMRVLEIGVANRRVGETAMNRESSRSHSVFAFTIQSTETKDGLKKERYSRFNLIDLAGSERQKSTAAAGQRLKEASRINKSLSALGNVILALSEIARGKARHVHYRDSKLTFLLKDSLGGNSLTYIVACVSPAADSFGETLSTLQFAQRAKVQRLPNSIPAAPMSSTLGF